MKNLEKVSVKGQKEIEVSIKRADKNLKSLNPLIYTPALKDLQEATEGLSVCAKSSGAGGGATVESPLVLTQIGTQTLVEALEEEEY